MRAVFVWEKIIYLVCVAIIYLIYLLFGFKGPVFDNSSKIFVNADLRRALL